MGLDIGSSMEPIYLDGALKAARRAAYIFQEAVSQIACIATTQTKFTAEISTAEGLKGPMALQTMHLKSWQ
jgi:hypothetical protein